MSGKKLNYQFLFVAVLLIAVIFIISWNMRDLNSSINILSAPAAQPASKNLMTAKIKLETVAWLLRGRQYGQWPLAAVPLSEDRGNPFAPQK